jgi:hypothetical protein
MEKSKTNATRAKAGFMVLPPLDQVINQINAINMPATQTKLNGVVCVSYKRNMRAGLAEEGYSGSSNEKSVPSERKATESGSITICLYR